MKRLPFALLALFLLGCPNGEIEPDNNGTTNNGSNNGMMGTCDDLDGDGFDGRSAACPGGLDCDDRSAQVNPSAAEACGDRRDNNCDGQADEGCQSMDCVDNDGDRYGTGTGCFGPDCDDNNAAINPGATEVCGNSIDEDCKMGDQVCPANCIDMDGDGYGAPGSTDCVDDQGNVLTEVDCDDNNAAINAVAVEVCDGADNNCDGNRDECPLPGQMCDGNRCQGAAGAECENADDCMGNNLTCDRSTDPKICRSAENGACADISDCVPGLSCDNGVCTGNFCAQDPCAGDPIYDTCSREEGQCLECEFDEATGMGDDAGCDNGQSCVSGGWCAFVDPIYEDSPDFEITASEEYLWLNTWLADCWITTRPAGEKKMCSAFVVDAGAIIMNEADAKSAYVDGHLDMELTMEENEALDDIWGEGFFNRKEIDWKATPTPGSELEVCLWYQPGGLVTGETMVLDRCQNFTP